MISGIALNSAIQNTNPQLQETIHIDASVKIDGQIENLTFGVELKGQPIKFTANPNHKMNHAVILPVVQSE